MSSLQLRARLAERDADFDLEIASGDVLAVLGPNGAGKSTLLSLIAGLLRPDGGRIVVGDRVLTDTGARVFVPPYQRGVAMLAQQAMLFPHMSVAANVAYGPRCRGHSRAGSAEIAQRWLAAVDADSLSQRRPRELSGGQAQRVAIARALATEPSVLLLDEPMAALDVAVAPAVRRLLRDILHAERRTAVIVTHDILDALAIATNVVVVDRGRIVERGTVREVLTAPRSEFAARIAGVNLVSGVMAEPGAIRTPQGDRVFGAGGPEVGTRAAAVFAPTAVSIATQPPHGSPRNIFRTTVTELEAHGATVRVRGSDQPDGSSALFADVTPAAVAELDLAPGRDVYFVVKAVEVRLHSALSAD